MAVSGVGSVSYKGLLLLTQAFVAYSTKMGEGQVKLIMCSDIP